MTHEWKEHFRALFAERGYEMLSCEYDPAYGWTGLYRSGSAEVEFEARSTTGVERVIRSLRPKEAA